MQPPRRPNRRTYAVTALGHKATGLLLNPGGHVEGDRTLLAAALREVCEETGLRPHDQTPTTGASETRFNSRLGEILKLVGAY
ncbi:NUDIX domain-containing protein [Streptomyces fagopyri]|uniref:NUDIX domain-containing protein n=1 Tax=Streptomyces fagopyri TaxID=2662397 RepID=UPI0038291527